MNAKDIRTTAAERLGAEESTRRQAAEEIADTGIPAGEQIGPAATKKPSKLLLVLAAMGPGVVTAMAGNDAGGISTYSTAGANFGFGTLWVIPIMCVLLAVVETYSAAAKKPKYFTRMGMTKNSSTCTSGYSMAKASSSERDRQ